MVTDRPLQINRSFCDRCRDVPGLRAIPHCKKRTPTLANNRLHFGSRWRDL